MWSRYCGSRRPRSAWTTSPDVGNGPIRIISTSTCPQHRTGLSRVAGAVCSVDGCVRPHRARGFCTRCYYRPRRAGTIQRVRLSSVCAQCRVESCTAATKALGLCEAHYWEDRATDPAKIAAHKAAQAAWIAKPENRARSAATTREWRQANPDKVAAHRQSWRAAHPDRTRELRRENQARRKARAQATQTNPIDYASILAEHGMICHICGSEIPDTTDLHFDHVIPLARGGVHTNDNIRPSHARCNMRKGARLLAG